MRDLYNNIGLDVVIANATYDADTTPAAVDLAGFNSAVIELAIGAGGITFSGTNKIEFVLTHSDDNSTYANVTADDVQGPASVSSGIVKSLVAAHATADVTKIGYIGGKRYIKLLADFSGTHGTGTPIGVTVIKGTPAMAPVA
jgi:hypothetical protein